MARQSGRGSSLTVAPWPHRPFPHQPSRLPRPTSLATGGFTRAAAFARPSSSPRLPALPCLAVPCLAVPHRALPCLTVACLASPRLALHCRAVLAVPHRGLPCLAVPRIALHCRAVLAVPCRASPWLASTVASHRLWQADKFDPLTRQPVTSASCTTLAPLAPGRWASLTRSRGSPSRSSSASRTWACGRRCSCTWTSTPGRGARRACCDVMLTWHEAGAL